MRYWVIQGRGLHTESKDWNSCPSTKNKNKSIPSILLVKQVDWLRAKKIHAAPYCESCRFNWNNSVADLASRMTNRCAKLKKIRLARTQTFLCLVAVDLFVFIVCALICAAVRYLFSSSRALYSLSVSFGNFQTQECVCAVLWCCGWIFFTFIFVCGWGYTKGVLHLFWLRFTVLIAHFIHSILHYNAILLYNDFCA